jgi:hypothetical protein
MRTPGLLILAAILMILGFENANATAILADPYWNEEMPNPEGADDANGSASETSTEVKPTELISAGASPLVAQDKLFASAYFDALSILAANNGCSDFFGGAAAASDVFAKLMGNVQKNFLPATVGINMTGRTMQVTNERTKLEYRLFEKVLINSNGPFYRNRQSQNLPLPGVGSFPANTNEVRVLMLLHELGHAIKGDDGNWLLLNDGKNSDLSRKNSQKIEDACGRQIKALRERNLKHDAQLLTAHKSKND